MLTDAIGIMLVADGRVERLRAISDSMSGGTSPIAILLVLVAGLALVWLLLLVARNFSSEPQHTPQAPELIEQALTHLNLPVEEADALRRVARRARLLAPAALLLSPANLAYAVDQARITPEETRLRQAVEQASQRLFGVGLPSA
jgi:hypothetical protein